MSPNAFLGEFEQMVLLAILQQSKAPYALEVRREIEASAGRTVSRGAFYTTLDRLERKGMLEWREDPTPPEGRRTGPLRRFSVTPAGRRALAQTRAALETLWRGLDLEAREG